MTDGAFINRRGMPLPERERKERLIFGVREVDRSTWHGLSKYHYLSEKLPGGHIELFGVFVEAEQIGIICYANYVPHRAGTIKQMHANRLVIHPDFAGIGLGIKVLNVTGAIMHARGYDVRSKFSSTPVYRAMASNPCWRLLKADRKHKHSYGANMGRRTGFRRDIKVFSFKFDIAEFDEARERVEML